MNQVIYSGWLILDSRQLSVAHVTQALKQIFEYWPKTQQRNCVLLSEDGLSGFGGLPELTCDGLAARLQGSTEAWVGYVPLDEYSLALRISRSLSDKEQSPFLAPWLPPQTPPQETATAANSTVNSWIATSSLVAAALPSLVKGFRWSLLAIAQALESQGINFHWRVFASDDTAAEQKPQGLPAAAVLAVIPHYQCEPWLHRCLTSMMQQTRPPDQVVVIDDGSSHPPLEILADFPTVTLLAAPENVGPYRLIQQVIEDTAYDYYFFQDADDWSSSDRLSRLLATAAQTDADLVGSQEIRVDVSNGTLTPVSYPLDVNDALREKSGHPLLHPTSLVRRRLVMAVDGFATGLRFGGDTEFLLRAAWMGRIVNDHHYAYFRQKRPDSLTTNALTGLDSPARQALLSTLKNRALENRTALHRGTPLNLAPLVQAAPIVLRHLAGPPLISRRTNTVSRS